jgi:hypothetical protein
MLGGEPYPAPFSRLRLGRAAMTSSLYGFMSAVTPAMNPPICIAARQRNHRHKASCIVQVLRSLTARTLSALVGPHDT